MELRRHNVVLRAGGVILRPMCERDWPWVYRWDSNPDVLRWVEGNAPPADLAAVQAIYRSVSQLAYCFIIKAGQPVGWCWLQRMNLPRILERYPGVDCRRIDLAIGEPARWSCGIGTTAIGLLTTFAFRDGAAMVFGCDIAGFNERSLRAFARCGYREVGRARDVFDPRIERIDMASSASGVKA
jgi:RimJ/RimL family protein N-acetyltransferase